MVEYEDCGTMDAEQDEAPIRPQFIGVTELVTGNPELHKPVIHGLLREREIGNIIAPPKRAKSWLALHIGLSVAMGRTIFDQHRTERGRVLLIDNELHAATLAGRVPKVAEAMGATLDVLHGWFFTDSLRGRLKDIEAMDSYFCALEPGYFKLVILDALYRFMPKDYDENSNAQATIIYNLLDRYATLTGAAFLIVHHASKGLQTAKSITDVGAGASAISRAADAHLILRDHEEDGAVVVESVERSWKPNPPICLRWEWPLWRLALDLNPTLLRKTTHRQRQQDKKDADPAPEPPKKTTPEQFAEAYVGSKAKPKDMIVALASEDEISEREAMRLLLLAVNRGRVFEHPSPDKDRRKWYANREPDLSDCDTHTRAHSPHTPQRAANAASGAGGARESESRKGGEQ